MPSVSHLASSPWHAAMLHDGGCGAWHLLLRHQRPDEMRYHLHTLKTVQTELRQPAPRQDLSPRSCCPHLHMCSRGQHVSAHS